MEDTFKILAANWLSRLQMDYQINLGSLIQNLKPSNLGRIKGGLWTLEVLEDKESCKLGTPTLDGGNCSDMKVKTL